MTGREHVQVDGRVVSRELTKRARPMLRSHGFDRFAGRLAWRDSPHTIDLVCFRSFTANIAEGVGCTSFSFATEVGVLYRCLDPQLTRPKDYHLTFRVHLGKSLRQPLFHPWGRAEATDRPEIWYVAPDGTNLADTVEDAVACVEAQGLALADRFADPTRAFAAMLTDDSTEASFGEPGVSMPGGPGSPRWVRVGAAIGGLVVDDPLAALSDAPVLAEEKQTYWATNIAGHRLALDVIGKTVQQARALVEQRQPQTGLTALFVDSEDLRNAEYDTGRLIIRVQEDMVMKADIG